MPKGKQNPEKDIVALFSLDRWQKALRLLCHLQAQADSIVSFLMDGNLVKLLKQDKSYNLHLLQEQYNIGPPQIEALYHFAKNKFECGNYQDAAEFLYHYRFARAQIAWLCC